MADFCAECSIKTFGENFGDMAGLCDPGYMTQTLCECCKTEGGMIVVDHQGIRVSSLEKERRVVDGETQIFFIERPEDEIEKARALIAQHQPSKDRPAPSFDAAADPSSED